MTQAKQFNPVEIPFEGLKVIADKTDYSMYTTEYKMMIQRLYDALKGDDRVKSVIFCNDDIAGGLTIQILTNRCTQFRTDAVIEPDHSNDKAVVDHVLAAWMKLPLEESDKEQYEGLFTPINKHIRFNREWNGYRFSDQQCEDLLNGKHIQFNTESKKGDNKDYCGILKYQDYKGFLFYGFSLDGWALPDAIRGHALTKEEKQALLAGKEVEIDGLLNKAGNTYNTLFTYNVKDGVKLTKFLNKKTGKTQDTSAQAVDDYLNALQDQDLSDGNFYY